jgi:hypothetical protein
MPFSWHSVRIRHVVARPDLFHGVHVAVLDENRKPAAAPDLRLLLDSRHAEFTEALNRWVDDRIGFRDLFIKIKNQIDYSVFKTAKKVYIGSNEFLFMREFTNSRLKIERTSDEEFERFKQSFVAFGERLGQRGVKLVLVIYPDKSALYPEHLPHNVPNFPRGWAARAAEGISGLVIQYSPDRCLDRDDAAQIRGQSLL